MISIVVTTFNSAKTIRDTLESIRRQTFGEYEVIVVDGASHDGTVEMIKEYESLMQGRLRWKSEPDRGVYDAMNKGIRMAEGDIVGILNSDDFYTSDDVLMQIQSAFDADLSIDAVYGDVHYVNPDNLSRPVRYYSSAKFTRKRMKMGYMPAHPSFYARKECYDKYGLFDTRFKTAADFELLLRLIYVNEIRIKYLPFDFVTMRTGGITTSGLDSYKHIISDHFGAFRKNGIRFDPFLYFCRFPLKLLEFSNREKIS